jgi:hypothetical protein
MRTWTALLGLFLAGTALAQEPATHPIFHVKYIAEGVVYLDGGRNVGLLERQILKVSPAGTDEGSSRGEQLAAEEIATIRVLSLADASAVCEVLSSTRAVQPGDVAILQAGAEPLVAPREAERTYLQVIEFTTEDPLEQEKRAELPRPPLPEINRLRGRIGVEYNTLLGHGQAPTRSSQVGLVLRGNMTRIGGTYWSFNGYWRGRLNRHSGSQTETVSDLLNRTYQLSLTYSNPFSPYVVGAGRMYLPWASSLEIIDGGYVGLRSAAGFVGGVFGGSTPDPTSWDYVADRRLGGLFFAVERGTFEDTHVLSTSGVAVSALGWRAERQFVFSENSLSYRRIFSVYESMQFDAPHTYAAANPSDPSTPLVTRYGGLNRSYLAFRVQPRDRLSFDLSHSYFRGMPTFDPVLIGTGLLDRYLFQGLSGGVRAGVLKQITLYTSVGRSSRSGDAKASWNRLHGVTFTDLFGTAWRADARYSRFNSAFGQGSYESLSLSRQLGNDLRLEVLGGLQTLRTTGAPDSKSHFVTAQTDWSPGRHLFLQTYLTWQRGGMTNYDQFSIVVGERF